MSEKSGAPRFAFRIAVVATPRLSFAKISSGGQGKEFPLTDVCETPLQPIQRMEELRTVGQILNHPSGTP